MDAEGHAAGGLSPHRHALMALLSVDLGVSVLAVQGRLELGHQRANFALANTCAAPARAVITILNSIVGADFRRLVGAVLMALIADTGS